MKHPFKYPQRNYIAYRRNLRTFRSKIIFQILKIAFIPNSQISEFSLMFLTINNHLKSETPGIQNRKGKKELKGKLLLAQ